MLLARVTAGEQPTQATPDIAARIHEADLLRRKASPLCPVIVQPQDNATTEVRAGPKSCRERIVKILVTICNQWRHIWRNYHIQDESERPEQGKLLCELDGRADFPDANENLGPKIGRRRITAALFLHDPFDGFFQAVFAQAGTTFSQMLLDLGAVQVVQLTIDIAVDVV
jgi:hypothetical protein